MGEVRVTVLKAIAADGNPCADGKTCTALLRVEGIPGRFVVSRQVDDPAIATALAPYVAADELVGWVPPGLITEV